MRSELKEIKPHGNADYAFAMYCMTGGNSNVLVTNHWHNETEILYIAAGEIYANINNEYCVGRQGDIIIANSGEMHELYGRNTELRYTAFVFDMKSLSFMLDDAPQRELVKPLADGSRGFARRILNNPGAGRILEDIIRLNIDKPPAYMLNTKADLLRFAGMCAEEGLLVERGGADSDDSLLKRIIFYINAHYTEKLTLCTIAREFNMSPKHFCRFFKKNFRRTFVEYVNTIRLERAMHLLERGEMSVTEAAVECGFSNMSYFARLFKNAVGCAPREYRAMRIK